MNRKNIFATAMAAVLLAGSLVSCSDDIIPDETTGNGTVTFSATLAEDHSTRAVTMGDGLSATSLCYAVYDSNGELVDEGNTTVNNRTANITLQLTTGLNYDIVFFAYRPSNTYKFNAAGKKVDINYAAMGSTVYDYKYDDDCFYQIRKGYKAGSSTQENVTLYRPMAQVNFGTNDLGADAVTKLYGSNVFSKISTKACGSLDLLTGEGTDEKTIEIRFHKPIKNTESLGDFPVSGYDYLTSAYILVNEPSELRTITLSTSKKGNATEAIQTIDVPNAPTKRNYRTNIYGSLLTTSSDWTVTIEPIFDGSTDVWTGNTDNPVKVDENNYTVNTPSQLAGLAEMVNSGNDFAGKTVTLTTDLDLNNINWTPIGTADKPFNGIFEGSGKTVSNLSITLGSTSIPAGLFGCVKSNGSNKGEVRNFTIDGATVNTLKALPAQYSTGVAVGWIYTGKCVENVIVKNAKVDAYRWTGGVVGKGYGSVNYCEAHNVDVTLHFEPDAEGFGNCDKAGAIVGQQDEGAFTLIGNKATDVNVTGYRHIGGLFGYVNYGNASTHKTVKDNSINGGKVIQNFTHNYDNIAAGELMGEISGFYGNDIDESNNIASDVTLVAPSTVTDAATLANAAKKGGFITLGDNLDLTTEPDPIELTQPTTLNLNGKKLTIKPGSLNNASELTIDGEGEITSSGFTICGDKSSKLIINNGTISTTTTDKYTSAIHTSGDVEINGGRIVAKNYQALVLNWPNNSTPSELVINGGEFISEQNGSGDTPSGDYAVNIYGGNSKAPHKAVINGGTFVGNAGVRIDGNVTVDIYGGEFIQRSVNSTGHALCAGAEKTFTTIWPTVNVHGGYFFGNPGQAICKDGEAKVIVSGAYVNKTTGSFTLGEGAAAVTLGTPVTRTVEGSTYSFGYQIK